MNRKTLSILVIAVQVCFFTGWYMVEAQAFDKPIATIKVKPEPYDPRDLLSGQYMRLNYEFSRTTGRWNNDLRRQESVNWAQNLRCADTVKARCANNYGLKQDGDVWITLRKGEDEFYHPVAASFNRPAEKTGDVVILGYGTTKASNITFGIEKYFVPEGTREPKREDTTILLDVYKGGKVRINTLLVKDKAWP